MMAGYTPRWYTNEGNDWKTILDSIKSVTTKLAQPEDKGGWGAEVTREHWDVPKFDLRWYTDDDIGRAVQVVIQGVAGHYQVCVSGSAWKDFNQPRERRWKAQQVKTISVPSDPSQLDLRQLNDALGYAREMISKWQEGDLKELAPRPMPDPRLGTPVRGQYPKP